MTFVGGVFSYEPDEDGALGDWWVYEDKQIPQTRLSAAAGFHRDEVKVVPITYEEMRPGCYEPKARVDDMEMNHVEASLCFPSFPRFCGQTFMEAKDQRPRPPVRAGLQRLDGRGVVRRVGRPAHPADHHPAVGRVAGRRRGAPQRRRAACTRCASARSRRTSGCRRCTTRTATGSRSSRPARRPATVICMHIGSSSKMPSTSPDAPPAVGSTLTFNNAMASLSDWLFSGLLVQLPGRQARLQRGPDRLDPVHPRAGRQGVGGQPGVGRRGRPGARAAEHLLLPPDLRLLLRRRGRPRATSNGSASTTSRSRPTTRTRTPRGPTRRKSARS